MNKIGFMQGRLSNLVNNQIQAFPFEDWTYEFELAKKIVFDCMDKLFLLTSEIDMVKLN